MSVENRNIFINCPFDDAYREKLTAIIFVVVFLGFAPRISLEEQASSTQRLEKIMRLINESGHSIHDLSRLKADDTNGMYRGNMPFELGIDFGCRKYSGSEQALKGFLILEKEKYATLKAVSDLNGFDIECHDDKASCAVEIVRNWLKNSFSLKNTISPDSIWDIYTMEFQEWYYNKATSELKYRGEDYLLRIPVSDYIEYVNEWLEIFHRRTT